MSLFPSPRPQPGLGFVLFFLMREAQKLVGLTFPPPFGAPDMFVG